MASILTTCDLITLFFIARSNGTSYIYEMISCPCLRQGLLLCGLENFNWAALVLRPFKTKRNRQVPYTLRVYGVRVLAHFAVLGSCATTNSYNKLYLLVQLNTFVILKYLLNKFVHSLLVLRNSNLEVTYLMTVVSLN